MHVCTTCADKTKATEGASNKLRAAVCTEQDNLKKFKSKSGQFQIATTCIAFVLTMMTMIIPAEVCLLIFIFGGGIIGIIGAFAVWDL